VIKHNPQFEYFKILNNNCVVAIMFSFLQWIFQTQIQFTNWNNYNLERCMTLKKIDCMLVEWWLKATFSLTIAINFASFWTWVLLWGCSCGKPFISRLLLALNQWPTSCNEICNLGENYNVLAMDWNTLILFVKIFLCIF
jgi:hypothetical protein